MCTLAALMVAVVMLGTARADPGHPQRPEKFINEEQLKKYMHDLKKFYEDSVRVGRFGKRNNYPSAMIHVKPYPKHAEPKWKNEYDYYTQFNN